MQVRPIPHPFGLCLLLAVLLSACGSTPTAPVLLTPRPTASHIAASATLPFATVVSATATPRPPLAVTATNKPGATVEPRTVTRAPTATAELLDCPPTTAPASTTRPVRLLYANGRSLWLWDEASQARTRVPLPEDAVAPRVSDDGRYITFLLDGQSHDSLESPLASIPLWLFDRDSGQARMLGEFATAEMRRLYPEAPQILLQCTWLPGRHWLLVEVHPVAWGKGVLLPTGDLFLVDAATGETQRILENSTYWHVRVRPDGGQIAALGPDFTPGGAAPWGGGILHLVDIPPAVPPRRVPVDLPTDMWAIANGPAYAPDGAHLALNVADGFAIIDAQTGAAQQVAFENTWMIDGQAWTPAMPMLWLPDGWSFYTLASRNRYFDERAETTLAQIHLEPAPRVEGIATIGANAETVSFSPDRRILAYYNQPDLETWQANPAVMNWVTLFLMDVQQAQPRQYAAEIGLRMAGWTPDGQRFVYSYGGQLALGHICQPPRALPLLFDSIEQLDETRWLVRDRLPAGQDGRHQVRLSLYTPDDPGPPLHIDDAVLDDSSPYGSWGQVVVLDR